VDWSHLSFLGSKKNNQLWLQNFAYFWRKRYYWAMWGAKRTFLESRKPCDVWRWRVRL
jgi:hypothetical protein